MSAVTRARRASLVSCTSQRPSGCAHEEVGEADELVGERGLEDDAAPAANAACVAATAAGQRRGIR